MAGETPGDNDDPFAYLYRSEPAAPGGQQQGNQTTQQFAVVGPDADTHAGAPTQTFAAQQVGYPAPAPPWYTPQQPAQYTAPQNTTPQYATAEYAIQYQPGVVPDAQDPAFLPAGGGQERAGRAGPLGVLAVVVVLLVAAGLGLWAMLAGGGDKTVDRASTAPSVAPQAAPSSAAPKVAFQPITVTADKLQLTGGAVLATDHKNYTGAGFVAGLDNQGSAAGWTVDVPKAGRYRLVVRYSNALGSDGQMVQRTLALSANGTDFGQIRMPVIGNWDAWGTTWRTVRLHKGENQILIGCGPQSSCHVNIDKLVLRRG